MARKRMIDPSFWIDEQLGTCGIEARLLFMGLISQADDDGRLNGHPALIKSIIYPYDLDITAEKVDEWLESLAQRNLIVRYTVNNQKYILVRNFKKHQTINKPVKSKLPEPPSDDYGSTTVVLREPEQATPSQEKGIEKKGREGNTTPDLLKGNPHEQRIMKLINECEIENLDFFPIEQLCSYIGVVDIEVIEFAVKKGSKKHINYALRTLEGLVKDGKTTKEAVTYLQAVPDKKKADPVLEDRKVEIARNKWISEGKDPLEFRYNAATGA